MIILSRLCLCHTLSLGWKENHFMLATLKLVPRLQIFYHILSRLVTPYHTLSPRLERKLFYISNFKISSQASDFLSHLVTSCHSLSHLITPYPLGWKENHFMLATLKLVPRLQMFYHILSRLATPYYTLSPRLEIKQFYVGNFKISSQNLVVITSFLSTENSFPDCITRISFYRITSCIYIESFQ